MVRIVRSVGVLAVVLACMLAGAAAADAATVCPTGCAYSTIQPAVAAAADGGVVTVAAGTYAGPIVLDRGIDLNADQWSARFTITGDGSGPTLTVGQGANVHGAIIEGSGSAAYPSVQFLAGSGTHNGYTTSELWDSTVRGSDIGAIVPATAYVNFRAVTFEANASVGVQLPSGSRADFTDGTIADSLVGIDATSADIQVDRLTITVPTGGTGIRATTPFDTDITSIVVRGGGRDATTGIVATGALVNDIDIGSSTFDQLAESIRIATTGGQRHEIGGNVFKVATATAPIVYDTSAPADVHLNFVACPAVQCPVLQGANAGVPHLVDVIPVIYPGDGSQPSDSDVTVRGSFMTTNTPVGLDYGVKGFLGASFDFSSTPEVTAKFFSGSEVVYGAHTGGVGTDQVIRATYLGRPVTATWHLTGGAPKPTTKPSVTGLARMRNRLHCDAGAWPFTPTSVDVHWRAAAGTSQGPDYVLTRADVIGGSVACIVTARFTDFKAAVITVPVTVVREPLGLRQWALNGRWRTMRCGASLAKPCRISQRIGIRFYAESASTRKVKAPIELQRRVRGRWVRWVTGTIDMPLRGGIFIPRRMVRAGTYRLHTTVPQHDVFAKGAVWTYWIVR